MNAVPSSDYFIVLVIFTAIVAVILLIQVSMLVGMFVIMRRSMAKFQQMAEEAKGKAYPIIAQAQSLMGEIAPKVKVAIANLEEVTQTVRKQAANVDKSVEDLVRKTNLQIRRVDEMVTATFDTLDQATKTIENAVVGPTRRVTGILNGVRAGIGVFLGKRTPAPPPSAPPAPGTVVEIPTQRKA